MTITQLEYFCAVCRYGSISKAAEALFVSHPAISIAIKSLENEFSIELYTRTGNRVILTDAGKAFYEKARDILQRCDDMYASFAGKPEDSCQVHVGIPPIRSVVLFPELLQAFQQKHSIPVVLHEYSSRRALEKLENGELDCCLVNLEEQTLAQWNHQILLRDRFAFYISSEHPLAQKEAVTAADLAEVPLILQNDDSILNRRLLQPFYQAGITPKVQLYTSQVLTLLKFLRSGCSGTFLYETVGNALQETLEALLPEDGSIASVPFQPEIRENLALVWPKGSYINQNVKSWIAFVKNQFLKKEV